jgi:hypothetical protein
MSQSEALSRLTVGDGRNEAPGGLAWTAPAAPLNLNPESLTDPESRGAIMMAPRIDVTEYPDALKAGYAERS